MSFPGKQWVIKCSDFVYWGNDIMNLDKHYSQWAFSVFSFRWVADTDSSKELFSKASNRQLSVFFFLMDWKEGLWREWSFLESFFPYLWPIKLTQGSINNVWFNFMIRDLSRCLGHAAVKFSKTQEVRPVHVDTTFNFIPLKIAGLWLLWLEDRDGSTGTIASQSQLREVSVQRSVCA